MRTKLVTFTVMESIIFMLNIVFISLIYKYIKKFGIRVVDKYILTSFGLLALALFMRSTINFTNYIIGFKYLRDNPLENGDVLTYEEEFTLWFHYTYPEGEILSIQGYLVAVILRNVSIGINIARWLVTLSKT